RRINVAKCPGPVHTRAVRLHAIEVMASYAATPLLLALLSPFLPGRGLVTVPSASAAECADGSSLAAQIGLAEMESEVTGDKLLPASAPGRPCSWPAPTLS